MILDNNLMQIFGERETETLLLTMEKLKENRNDLKVEGDRIYQWGATENLALTMRDYSRLKQH